MKGREQGREGPAWRATEVLTGSYKLELREGLLQSLHSARGKNDKQQRFAPFIYSVSAPCQVPCLARELTMHSAAQPNTWATHFSLHSLTLTANRSTGPKQFTLLSLLR